MKELAHSLDAIVEYSQHLKQVHKADLHAGDWVFVKTLNSLYSIRVVDGGLYCVSGGWFDRKNLSPMRLTINGCTWGGSVIKRDIIAGCGLCLEFGNRVITSAIQKIFVLPHGSQN